MSGLPARPSRALLVTPVSPFEGSSGAQQRSRLMLQALQGCYTVDVLQLSEGAGEEVSAQPPRGDVPAYVLARVRPHALPWQRFRPRPAFTRRVVEATGRPLAEYALAVGRYLWPISQLALPRQLRTLVDLDDWRYRYASTAPLSFAAASERMLKFAAHWLAVRELQRFQGAFVASARDDAEVSRHLPSRCLPNVASTMAESLSDVPATHHLVFVGSLWYRPNAEGADWFLRQVWPAVLRAVPDANLTLFGAATPGMRARWESFPRVRAPGFADDLDAVYRDASAVIVPIHTGGGTNIKVIEAMAHGRPCVVTDFIEKAFAGEFEAERHFRVGRSASDFAAQVVLALDAPGKQAAMVERARRLVAESHTPRRFKSIVSQFACPPWQAA